MQKTCALYGIDDVESEIEQGLCLGESRCMGLALEQYEGERGASGAADRRSETRTGLAGEARLHAIAAVVLVEQLVGVPAWHVASVGEWKVGIGCTHDFSKQGVGHAVACEDEQVACGAEGGVDGAGTLQSQPLGTAR